jgi:hypothetical protein
MKQTLLMKGRSLMLTVLFTLSLAALIMLSGAASKAEAQSAAPDLSATNTVLQQLEDDGKLNSDMTEQLEAQNRLENSSGAATATPTASASAPAASASASVPATTASPSAPAASASVAQDQYKELPDTAGKAVAPAETTEAKPLPNTDPGTDGNVAAPAKTTEATGPSETNRNSSVLPFMLGSSALLVGGGLLARRLIR